MNNKEKRIKEIQNIIKNKGIKAYGVEIPLTDEQVKEFEKMVKPKYKIPYERVEKGEDYYYITRNSYYNYHAVFSYTEENSGLDDAQFNSGNYYNNEEFAKQIAMEMNLQQKLRKFTYDNGWKDELWEDKKLSKYYIYYDAFNSQLKICPTNYIKQKDIYFKTEEIAQRAIDEIILPFMEENPTFKW